MDQLRQHQMSQDFREAPEAAAKRQRTGDGDGDSAFGATGATGQGQAGELYRALSMAGDQSGVQPRFAWTGEEPCTRPARACWGSQRLVPPEALLTASALDIVGFVVAAQKLELRAVTHGVLPGPTILAAGLAGGLAVAGQPGSGGGAHFNLPLAASAQLPRTALQHAAAQQGLLSAVALASASAAAAPAGLPTLGLLPLHPQHNGSGSGSHSQGVPSSAEGSGEAPGPRPCGPGGAEAQGQGGRRQCRTDQERQTATKEKNRRAQQRFRRAGGCAWLPAPGRQSC
jgi:hypothetical protein